MSARAENGILARREGQSALAPDVWLLHRPACVERAGDADHPKDDLLVARRRVSVCYGMQDSGRERTLR